MAITLIGDVVTARRFTDQVALLQGLDGVLRQVNEHVETLQPLALAHRDEFRGTFPSIAAAVEAALRVRLASANIVLATDDEDEAVDVRIGIGEGEIVTLDQGPDAPDAQSGSAWWCARDALDAAFELPRKAQWPPSIRIVFRSADAGASGFVNAYLLCQDQLFARMDLRDRRALQGLLDGERQIDIATALGITQPAVARRLRDRGALAIKRGLEALREPQATTTPSPGV